MRKYLFVALLGLGLPLLGCGDDDGPSVLGQECEENDDCASNFCVTAPSNRGFCALPCNLDSPACTAGYNCVDVGAGSGACLATCGAVETVCVEPLTCGSFAGGNYCMRF